MEVMSMPRQENVLSVFVASPSDVAAERSRLEEVVTELNHTWSRSLGIRLELLRWETHSYPGFGDDAQDVINRQVPADYDIFLGIMWHRFGSPTGRAGSGTEEEFLRAKKRWDDDHTAVQLMFYFKDAPISPSQINPEQLGKIAEFRKNLSSKEALYWDFSTTDSFIDLVRMHLSRVVQAWLARLPRPQEGQKMTETPVESTIDKAMEEGDDNQLGMLELSEQFEENVADTVEIITRIVRATEVIGKRVMDHSRQIEAAKSAGQIQRPKAKRMITKVANDMMDYAAKLHADVPRLRDSLQLSLSTLSQAVALLPDFVGEQRGRDQAADWVKAIQELRQGMSTTENQITGFQLAVAATPRLTTDLNRAKRVVASELQSFIDLLKSMQQNLLQSERAAVEFLGKHGES
jgi:hypothetical protein